jgi:PAS domain S-box-containing protein/diguanylate cyclase (GGDEF)-like protein
MHPERTFAGVDRPLLDGVLSVVRKLGSSTSLRDTLDLILDGIVRVVGFDAAAVNVTTPTGELRVEAVAGPPGVERLLGTVRPMSFWTEVLAAAEPWGGLRFFGHDRDQTLVDRFATWTAMRAVGPDPDAWHPDDSLLAPMWGGDGCLIGVISVDEPRSGRRPDLEQCTILEVFAAQAAKAILDAQAREATDADRREAETRWRLAFEHSPTGMALVSPDRGVLEVNDALVSMLGTSREILLATDWSKYTHPDDVDRDDELFAELVSGKRDGYQMEKRFVRADGSVVWVSLHVGSMRQANGDVAIVSQVVDITGRKQAADRLAYQRTHDLLTDLPNRVGLAEEITRMLTLGRPVGVLFCNVTRFRAVNNGLGRDAGDELLVALAARLSKTLPADCVVGRVSGDEFAVLIPDENRPARVVELGETINHALAEPVEVQGMSLRVSMTIGAATSTPAHRTGDELMREAEQSLAAAKLRRRGAVESFDTADVRLPTRADLQLEQDLRAAVETGAGLGVFLQPIVNLESGLMVGAESLLRWRHPSRGLLLPDAIVPIAEESGLIVPLGLRTLGLSLDAADGAWMRHRGWVAVNVSASQLGRGQLPAAVRQALEERGLPPDRLHLEITETALAHASAAAIREVHEIAEMGVSIALDDFGTGYSSLSLLRDLPISVVKIDRSFIAPIAEERRAAALVRSLVVMCDSLGIGTVAEGVETPDQRAVVSALGCDHAQGYLFGRPIDVADLDVPVAATTPGRERPRRRPRPGPGPR